MAPDRPALRQALVRLGRLDFDDFRLLPPEAVRQALSDPDTLDDWQLALNNAPHILVHFRRCCSAWSLVIRQSSLADIASAQSRLVLHHALLLLREKAPPLYDALPWHEWDFSTVTKKYRLWQTRLFLAGDGTSAILPVLRKSAGAVVFEPSSTLARYVQRKAELERIRRFRLLPASLPLSLAPGSFDLAIIGSIPWLPTAEGQQVISEALRITRDVLVVENNPLVRPLPKDRLTGLGLEFGTVRVAGLGLRPCWWRRPD